MMRLQRVLHLLPAVTLFVVPMFLQTDAQAASPADSETVIRVLPLKERRPEGKVLVEALLVEPDIRAVHFYVDGELAARRTVPRWEAKVSLASPPREQVIRVEALGERGTVLGSDEMVVNRVVRPLKVSILSLDASPEELSVRASVSWPDAAVVDRITLHLGEVEVAAYTPADLVQGELHATIGAPADDPQAYVRVVAHLADGRRIEDVRLVSARGYEEAVDVHLVQLQVLVTDKGGFPLDGLRKENFEIRERGVVRPAAGLFVADDVSLLLGFAVDSSGSMLPIWRQTREAASRFLDRTLTDRDEGFLVDFDTRLRLVQARTGNMELLEQGLDELEPEGGTALYDSILYSMLQFDRQQGRRGLVVLTDGYDIDSRADPRRAVEFGQKLGVPIYIVAVEDPNAPFQAAGGAAAAMAGSRAAGVHVLRLLTDPTGGRLYRVSSIDQMVRAFAHINAEMRSQYVLTYYTDDPPRPGEPPKVSVNVPGQKGVTVKTVFGADQVY